MLSAETLLSIIAVLGVLQSILGIAHMFKLDGLLAAKLDAVADAAVAKAKATADPNDDRVAQAEADIIHAATAMLRSGKVTEGISLLEGFLKRRAG